VAPSKSKRILIADGIRWLFGPDSVGFVAELGQCSCANTNDWSLPILLQRNKREWKIQIHCVPRTSSASLHTQMNGT
jgi:hypothetical protein